MNTLYGQVTPSCVENNFSIAYVHFSVSTTLSQASTNIEDSTSAINSTVEPMQSDT